MQDTRICTGDIGGDIGVWDTQSGECLAVLEKTARMPAQFLCVDDGKSIFVTGDESPPSIWSRRRPEYWWGIAWLPEFWVALVSGGALLVIAARNLRRRFAPKPKASNSPA